MATICNSFPDNNSSIPRSLLACSVELTDLIARSHSRSWVHWTVEYFCPISKIAHSFACPALLASLARALRWTPHCFLNSRALLCSLICWLAYTVAPEFIGQWNIFVWVFKSLAPLTQLLAPPFLLCSRAPLNSFICSLTHSITSELMRKRFMFINSTDRYHIILTHCRMDKEKPHQKIYN